MYFFPSFASSFSFFSLESTFRFSSIQVYVQSIPPRTFSIVIKLNEMLRAKVNTYLVGADLNFTKIIVVRDARGRSERIATRLRRCQFFKLGVLRVPKIATRSFWYVTDCTIITQKEAKRGKENSKPISKNRCKRVTSWNSKTKSYPIIGYVCTNFFILLRCAECKPVLPVYSESAVRAFDRVDSFETGEKPAFYTIHKPETVWE